MELSKEAESLRKQGAVLHRRKRFTQAIDLFSQAHSIQPLHPTPLSNRSSCLFQEGKYRLAAADLEEAIDLIDQMQSEVKDARPADQASLLIKEETKWLAENKTQQENYDQREPEQPQEHQQHLDMPRGFPKVDANSYDHQESMGLQEKLISVEMLLSMLHFRLAKCWFCAGELQRALVSVDMAASLNNAPAITMLRDATLNLLSYGLLRDSVRRRLESGRWREMTRKRKTYHVKLIRNVM